MHLRILVAVLALALAGCSEPATESGQPLTQAEAEESAESAIEAMQAGFQDRAGDLRGMTGSMQIQDPNMGSGSLEMTIELGKSDSMYMQIAFQAGGLTFNTQVWCSPDREMMEWGGQVFESRPSEACNEMDAQDDLSFNPFDASSYGEFDAMEVVPNDDGSVTVFVDQDGAQIELRVIGDRVQYMILESDEANGRFDLDYGARRNIEFPAADERNPAAASTWCWQYDGDCDGSFFADGMIPLDEFEIRVYPLDHDDEPALATFSLDAGQQSAGGYTFSFTDDGDGMLSNDDSYVLTGPEGDVVLWDLWADKDVEDQAIPGLPVAAILLALIGIVAIMRR